VISYSQIALQALSTPQTVGGPRAQMASKNQSPLVQGFHSVSSSDYGSPPHLEPYSHSVVVTKQGGGTLSSTSGSEASISGRHQATAQLEDRGRSPPIVGLGHPTALAPHTPQPVLPPTAEVDIPTITFLPQGAFHTTTGTHSTLVGGMQNIPPTLQTRTPVITVITNQIRAKIMTTCFILF